MIFIVSLFLKVNPKRAFFSALRAGVELADVMYGNAERVYFKPDFVKANHEAQDPVTKGLKLY